MRYAWRMRGGVARWKRGVASQGVKQAIAYAFGGVCDSSISAQADAAGVLAATDYAGTTLTRFTVQDGQISTDGLDREQLKLWIDGSDPLMGEHRGRELPSPAADLVLDATINSPKSFSVAAMLDADLAVAYNALQDRLRDRIITTWQRELNARRGAAGVIREDLSRIEVVELQHERSRSLDPHKHRHLWLNIKVQGVDGRWSNIDSRVALKFQTVINAEGDLASRTDPLWVAALAAKGYTLNERGEIAELEHLVRPLSRRSTQIEANRAFKLGEWERAHPGQEPDRGVLAAIDRWSWAAGRPNKPGTVNEDEWVAMVVGEVAALDASVLKRDGLAVPIAAVSMAGLDRDLLAAKAIVDADKRSAGSGGRFSLFDVRGGAIRAVAASGVMADRALLTELIEDVTARAVTTGAVSMVGEAEVPGHVKAMMATGTATLKVALAGRLDGLHQVGVVVPADAVADVATDTLEAGRTLDAGQRAAAGAIAGTDRLVTVTGPAGTGKTTMLKVAREALVRQGRRMIVVAPTKKAASVAGRETGAAASSLHGLLHDFGWRWVEDAAGRTIWSRLAVGDADSVTGVIYEGARKHTLTAGDRVVVDEAGMVDLETAHALAELAAETGAGIAMVGDHLQALPVGHSGAMSLVKQRSSVVVELSAVHRFKDPAWAALSLRLRQPASAEDAADIARTLLDGGHVVLVANDQAVREHMIEAWLTARGRGESAALVTATHAEAQLVSEAIQARRIQAGQVDTRSSVTGQDDQAIYIGDVVQTRRNSTDMGVENRALWVVQKVTRDGIVLANAENSTDTRTVSGDYAASSLHLGYASTVHGIQGETTDVSIVGPGVDAGGLYVGMTRGRRHNEVVLTAATAEPARAELVAMMHRGRVEATLDEGREAARAELARAARTPVIEPTGPPAAWDDKKRRPAGAVEDVVSRVSAAAGRQGVLHKELATVVDELAGDRRTLAELEARLATTEAGNHQLVGAGGRGKDVVSLVTVRERLHKRIQEATERRATLSREYRQVTARVESGKAELALREKLPAAVAQREERERLAVVHQSRRAVSDGPVIVPERSGRGGPTL